MFTKQDSDDSRALKGTLPLNRCLQSTLDYATLHQLYLLQKHSSTPGQHPQALLRLLWLCAFLQV
jgi:hypothetical protein